MKSIVLPNECNLAGYDNHNNNPPWVGNVSYKRNFWRISSKLFPKSHFGHQNWPHHSSYKSALNTDNSRCLNCYMMNCIWTGPHIPNSYPRSRCEIDYIIKVPSAHTGSCHRSAVIYKQWWHFWRIINLTLFDVLITERQKYLRVFFPKNDDILKE